VRSPDREAKFSALVEQHKRILYKVAYGYCRNAEDEEAFAADSDNMRALAQLLSELDELSRALVILFLEGLAHDEIAEVLGISASNVGTRLNRIKTRLQQGFAAA
jgi:DNA-directed RNA polymerase specialized sigma24 family protein